MCECMMVTILSVHTVRLPEIQDLLTLQRAVLLINLSSPGRFDLVVTGGCLCIASEKKQKGT